MSISGYLEEFSLAELLQMLDSGKRTGLLTVRCSTAASYRYLWFRDGQIVAAADRRDGKGLILLLRQREWLSARVVAKLLNFTDATLPLGTRLQSQGALSSKQVKQLFFLQVMQQMYRLLEMHSGNFQFTPDKMPPATELTGLSQPAIALTLVSLRSVKDWRGLSEKLPLATSGVARTRATLPTLPLTASERNLWASADGRTPLTSLAQHLGISVAEVQQMAFRLHLAGLIAETPAIAPTSPAENASHSSLSHSFFNTLSGFLSRRLAPSS